ncbi:MAG: ribose 5-phosphate isomerase B [Spirochaetales bacterium]|nr:ribose 5-phosphate isomerase B [Spirochaetales bacterium]
MPKVVVANDHGAVELAQRLIEHLKERGYEVTYLGTDKNESVDYPDKAKEACQEYLKGGYEFGIVLCGTGIGISISANKIKGIRCSLLTDCYSAEMTKRHNNPNFIAFGGRVDYKDDPVKMLDSFIDAKFEGGRHQKRIDKMMALEG